MGMPSSLVDSRSPLSWPSLSVANSKPNFSARSAKKFGRWRKNSAPPIIFTLQTNYVAKVYKKLKISAEEEYVFCRAFYVKNTLLKNSAPFQLFFGKYKENSTANFSGSIEFCEAPFVLCGQNFGPLATLSSLVFFRIGGLQISFTDDYQTLQNRFYSTFRKECKMWVIFIM
jgi:hypothetical protein